MLQCFNSVRYKLDRKLGYFDLLGFDFMLDENFKVKIDEKTPFPSGIFRRQLHQVFLLP